MVLIKNWTPLILTILLLHGINSNKLTNKWQKHLQHVKNFKCGKPQPRTIPAQKLLEESVVKTAQRIYPFSTMLNRCGGSGYCEYNMKCSPTTKKTVTLVFFIKNFDNSTHYIKIKALNHTMCGCKCKDC